jgi:hypothetical protein
MGKKARPRSLGIRKVTVTLNGLQGPVQVEKNVDFTKLKDIPTRKIEAWLRHARGGGTMAVQPQGHYRYYTIDNLVAELAKRTDRVKGNRKEHRRKMVKQKRAAAKEGRP